MSGQDRQAPVEMPERLRIFISSPGDVFKERLRVELVVERLAQDYGRYFILQTYRWEWEPMLASGHFQDSIEPPSAFDIVASDRLVANSARNCPRVLRFANIAASTAAFP